MAKRGVGREEECWEAGEGWAEEEDKMDGGVRVRGNVKNVSIQVEGKDILTGGKGGRRGTSKCTRGVLSRAHKIFIHPPHLPPPTHSLLAIFQRASFTWDCATGISSSQMGQMSPKSAPPLEPHSQIAHFLSPGLAAAFRYRMCFYFIIFI